MNGKRWKMTRIPKIRTEALFVKSKGTFGLDEQVLPHSFFDS